ncbi:unnamed protein product, partial [Staurois parvus]
VICDWSQLVTWYKAVVDSLVPCDLCDHSQISHVVSNDVRSDILLTTIHVITDWPIGDHMIRTSHRGSVHRLKWRVPFINGNPAPALLPSGRLYTWAGREVVNGDKMHSK